MSELTEQQELFAQNLAMGMSQYLAYKNAFGADYSKAALYVESSRLANTPKIALRVAELKKELNDLKLWERADALLILKDIVEDNKSDKKDIIAAIREMNNICGFNIDKKQIDLKETDNIKKVVFEVIK